MECLLQYKLLSPEDLEQLRTDLLSWYTRHRRDLPWRRTVDPYAIWISEIMLQQTRVAAVIPFFERFLERFPNIQALAAAPDEELLSHWAGLGYYYRARNMRKAAREIAAAGAFPNSYQAIAALPGIGPYTAAAVASIAFNLPHPVVDGNVYRVLSRVFHDRTNIAAAGARKHFTNLASIVLDHEQPGAFNQALMELGATVCVPRRPQCLICPLTQICRARAAGDADTLPVKIRAKKSHDERRTVLWVAAGGRVLLWQRPETARLMPGFWELPEEAHLPGRRQLRFLGTFRHAITVHNYRFEIWEADLADTTDIGECRWVEEQDLPMLPTSTILRKALRHVRRSVNRVSAASVS